MYKNTRAWRGNNNFPFCPEFHYTLLARRKDSLRRGPRRGPRSGEGGRAPPGGGWAACFREPEAGFLTEGCSGWRSERYFNSTGMDGKMFVCYFKIMNECPLIPRLGAGWGGWRTEGKGSSA